MATRMVTDCDKCGKEGINDASFRLEVTISAPDASAQGEAGSNTEVKRLDLDVKCLGQELQSFLTELSPEEGAAWVKKLQSKSKPGKKAA